MNDMLADPRGALVPDTEWEPQASIIVPLTVGGKVIGVLAIDRMGRARPSRSTNSSPPSCSPTSPPSRSRTRAATSSSSAPPPSSRPAGACGTSSRRSAPCCWAPWTCSDGVSRRSPACSRRSWTSTPWTSGWWRGAGRARVHLLARRQRRARCGLPHTPGPGRERLGGAPQRGATRERHGPRPARVIQVPGTQRGGAAGLHHRAAQRAWAVTGVLCLDRVGGREFADHELEPVKLFANLAAIAIQNARTLRGDGAPGHQRRPDRHPQLPALPRDAQAQVSRGGAVR